MPLKINVGLSKKLGLPDYGSAGASCHVEFEVEGSLLQSDLDGFHRHVRNAYVACRQAVQDELARHQPNGGSGDGRVQQQAEPQQAHGSASSTQSDTGRGYRNGNGNSGHAASQKQVDYIQQLARQIRGLGVRRLDTLADKMFGKPMATLTSMDASGLIDTLKAIKAGEIQLEAALSGDPR